MGRKGSPQLDALDYRILSLLQEDGRASYTALAEELGVTESTVRKRLGRLLEEGVVRVVGVLNPSRLGRETAAMVGIRVDGDRGEEVAQFLATLPQVRSLVMCAGLYDLIAQVVVTSQEELFHFLTRTLREVPGVRGSDTSLILRVYKDAAFWRLAERATAEKAGNSAKEAKRSE